MNIMAKEWKEFQRNYLFFATFILIFVTSSMVIMQYRGLDVSISFRGGLVPIFQSSLYFLPFLAMVFGAFAILQEKSQKTMQIMLTRWFSPSQFIMQKSIAVHLLMGLTTLISYLLVMLVATTIFNGISLGAFIYFLLALFLVVIIFGQLGILIGSFFETKIQVLGAILVSWFFFLFIFDLILMYWVPNVDLNGVGIFSVVYFISPINAIQYFLLVGLDVYKLSNFTVVYNHLTFQSPNLVVIINAVLWVGLLFLASVAVLKKRGVNE